MFALPFNSLPCAYLLFATIRVLLTIIPQPGYIHPDEYFQSIEVLIGDIFSVQSSSVWDFDKEFPIRNIFVPYAVYGIPLTILKYLMLLGYNIGTTPYLFVTLPRLMCCCISFLVDFSLYKICKLTKTNPKNYMLLLSSSYVMLLYGTRTFSNTIEMVLFSVLLYIVSDCMVNAQKIHNQYNRLELDKKTSTTSNAHIRKALAQSRLSNLTVQKCAVIATILAVGVYNRPTFLIFGLAPIFFWLRRSVKKPVNLWIFNYRIWYLLLASVPTVFLLTLVDSVYYGYTSWQELINMKAVLNKSYVVTPYNFFRYNSNVTNLSSHGLHPRYLHALINVPLLFNVLGVSQIIVTVFHVYRFFVSRRMQLPELQSVYAMLFFSATVPLICLSFFPHQELRFLIPLILPVILLRTETIYPVASGFNSLSTKWKTILWYTCNVVLFVFYSYLHQGGIYHLTTRLSEMYRTSPRSDPLCVITSHTYSIPMALIHAPHFRTSNLHDLDRRKTFIHNLGSSHSFDVIPTAVKTMQHICRAKKRGNNRRRTYFILPTILSGLLYETAVRHNMSYSTEQIYYAHFSSEVFGKIFENYMAGRRPLRTRYDTDSDMSEQSLFDYLGLSVIQFH